MNATFRNFALLIIIALVLIALFNLLQSAAQRPGGPELAYSTFLTDVNSGKVRSVTIAGRLIVGTYTDMTTFQTYSPDDPTLVQKLTDKNVRIAARAAPEGGTSLIGMLISWFPFWFPLLLTFAAWIFVLRQLERMGKALGLARSKAKHPTEAPIAVRVMRLPHADGLPLPTARSAGAAGFDLAAAVTDPVVMPPGGRAVIPTGYAIALPEGSEGQVRPRSGLAADHGVTVLNAPGTIDADYRGEVKVLLVNLGAAAFTVTRGMRIAQLVIASVLHVVLAEVATLEETPRGTGGFGSTGV
jgi:dUTP pyrophosphatase